MALLFFSCLLGTLTYPPSFTIHACQEAPYYHGSSVVLRTKPWADTSEAVSQYNKHSILISQASWVSYYSDGKLPEHS